MPRLTRKSYTRGYSRSRSRSASAMDIAKRVQHKVKVLEKQSEATEQVNVIEISNSLTSVATGAFNLLNGMAVNTTDVLDDGTRVGKKVVNKFLHFNYCVQGRGPSTTYQYPCSMRVIIFWDKIASDAAPDISEILQTVVQGGGTGAIPGLAPLNHNNMGRFHFIYDSLLDVDGGLAPALGGGYNFPIHSRTLTIPLGETETTYDGAGALITAIEMNSLYVFNVPTFVTPGPYAPIQFNAYSMLTYLP